MANLKETVNIDNINIFPDIIEVHRCESAPFVHRVATKLCKYIYDVNTNEILKVDDCVWDIIQDVGELSREDIIAKYTSMYNQEKILSAYDQIREAQKKGLFLSRRPQVFFEFGDKSEGMCQALNSEHKRLVLKVSEACNFRCAYCPYTITSNMRRTHSDLLMSWEVARTAIDNFIANCRKDKVNNLSVYFYGGEPLLNFCVIEKCVKYFNKIIRQDEKVTFWISTNGSLLKGSISEFLVSEKFFITVSLDGPEEIHNKNRLTVQGAGTWKLIIDNIRKFLDKYYITMQENGGSLNITAVLPPEVDALEFDDFFKEFNLFGPDGFLRATLVDASVAGVSDSPKNHLPKNLSKLKARYLNDLVEDKIDIEKYTVVRNLFEKSFRAVHDRNATSSCYSSDAFKMPTSMCVPGVTRYYVSVDGNYYPCEKVPECDAMKIGDVREGIDSQKAYQLSRDFFELNVEECRYCWCLRMCQVGCVADIRNGLQWTEKAKRQACIRHRSERHDTLIAYCETMEKNPHAFDYLHKKTKGFC